MGEEVDGGVIWTSGGSKKEGATVCEDENRKSGGRRSRMGCSDVQEEAVLRLGSFSETGRGKLVSLGIKGCGIERLNAFWTRRSGGEGAVWIVARKSGEERGAAEALGDACVGYAEILNEVGGGDFAAKYWTQEGMLKFHHCRLLCRVMNDSRLERS